MYLVWNKQMKRPLIYFIFTKPLKIFLTFVGKCTYFVFFHFRFRCHKVCNFILFLKPSCALIIWIVLKCRNSSAEKAFYCMAKILSCLGFPLYLIIKTNLPRSGVYHVLQSPFHQIALIFFHSIWHSICYISALWIWRWDPTCDIWLL